MSPRSPIRLAAALAAVSLPALAQNHFTEEGAQRGFTPFTAAGGFTIGAAAADHDGDGDVDVFLPTRHGFADRLYRNLGDGVFEEVGAALGVASTGNHRAALWFDADGDYDLDLVVGGDRHNESPDPSPSSLVFYRQETPDAYVEATAAAGLSIDLNVLEDSHLGGLCAGDVDGDGDLDLYVAVWEGGLYLFANDGAGHFTDVSAMSGIQGIGPHWQPVMFDADGDGWLDIFQAVDFSPNILWRNLGGGVFTDVAPAAGVDNAFNEMGVALGDVDGDQDFDVYVTNIFSGSEHNLLYRNDTTPLGLDFTEVSGPAGVGNTGCGWGTTFLDAGHSGRVDLVATNGGGAGGCATDPTRFFRNLGGFTFCDESATVGVYDPLWGGALLAFDAEGDGDLDLLQPNMQGVLLLKINELTGPAGTQNHLVVRPRQAGGNHRAIGAVVRVTAGGATQSRLISAGTSMLGQEPAEAHFGVQSHVTVEVRVEWPDGEVSQLAGVPVNQVLTLTHATGRYCPLQPNSAGPGAQISSLGTTSLALADFTLAVTGAPAGVSGLFYSGTEATRVPFGDGFRCVAGGVLRGPVTSVGPDGGAQWAFVAGSVGAAAGTTRTFQFWYRDPAAGTGSAGFNLSDGLLATFLP